MQERRNVVEKMECCVLLPGAPGYLFNLEGKAGEKMETWRKIGQVAEVRRS